MIDLLVAVASLLVIAVPVGIMGAWAETRGIDAIGRFVCSWRPEGWPVGVQEEDDERRWTQRAAPPRSAASGGDSGAGSAVTDILDISGADAHFGAASGGLVRVRGVTRRPNLGSN